MQHKADIGDDTDDIVAIPLIELHRFVIAGSHQHFGSGTLTEQLLLLVERIADSDRILLQYQFV